MRFVRILLSVLLVIFGFVAALFLLLLGRLFGRSGSRPAVNVRFQRPGPRPASPPPARGDVIDIEATPVKDA
jgi:hypothetical protein